MSEQITKGRPPYGLRSRVSKKQDLMIERRMFPGSVQKLAIATREPAKAEDLKGSALPADTKNSNSENEMFNSNLSTTR